MESEKLFKEIPKHKIFSKLSCFTFALSLLFDLHTEKNNGPYVLWVKERS